MSNLSDFKINKNGMLTKYIGSGGDVVIPDGVKSIGYAAFYNQYHLRSVTFSQSVTSIGNQAFEDCKNLAQIELPIGLQTIGSTAFRGCINLEEIILPTTVESIGTSAFSNCPKLSKQNELFIINKWLLDYHGNREIVDIPDSVSHISDGAFCGNHRVTNIQIPSNVKHIGYGAFKFCNNLKSIIISDGVTKILYKTFHRCKNLTQVILPDSVVSIEDAFDVDSKILQININDLSILQPKFRPYAAVCYAEDGGLDSDPRCENHRKYIKTNSLKLLETSIEHPALLELMCNEKLIAPKNVSTFIEAIQRTGNPELISLILNYNAQKTSSKEKKIIATSNQAKEEHIITRKIAKQNAKEIKGLNFAVSGEIATYENRKKLKQTIEDLGGKLLSSLSANVDYLITNDTDINSEKIKKARDLQIDIINEYQFNELANRQFIIDEHNVLIRYIGSNKAIVPEGVVAIETEAFFYHQALTDIVLPSSVHTLNPLAICDCFKLENIFISNSTMDIDISAVCGCNNVTIHAPIGSSAEEYAKKKGIPFVVE